MHPVAYVHYTLYPVEVAVDGGAQRHHVVSHYLDDHSAIGRFEDDVGPL